MDICASSPASEQVKGRFQMRNRFFNSVGVAAVAMQFVVLAQIPLAGQAPSAEEKAAEAAR